MTENALSILIVIFFVQLQQTEISEKAVYFPCWCLFSLYFPLSVRAVYFPLSASLTDALKGKVPTITINDKQHANKNQKIVIIKPLAYSWKSIFSNPVKFTKALMESPFNSDQIKEICTNKQSQTIVAELIIPNQNLLDKLLSVNQIIVQIGEWLVECYIPTRDKFKYGVIYPVYLGKLKHDIKGIG